MFVSIKSIPRMFNFLPNVLSRKCSSKTRSLLMLGVEDGFQVSVLSHYLAKGFADLLFIFQLYLVKLP